MPKVRPTSGPCRRWLQQQLRPDRVLVCLPESQRSRRDQQDDRQPKANPDVAEPNLLTRSGSIDKNGGHSLASVFIASHRSPHSPLPTGSRPALPCNFAVAPPATRTVCLQCSARETKNSVKAPRKGTD